MVERLGAGALAVSSAISMMAFLVLLRLRPERSPPRGASLATPDR
jgi:hypothetical protein